MERHTYHDFATSNVLAWTATQSANVEPSTEEDAGADADEPPDCRTQQLSKSKQFSRAPVRRGSEHPESLLTKALQSHSDEEAEQAASLQRARRRRSITSNFSQSSDVTCDTGLTTPARTNSPSPHLPGVGFVPIFGHASRQSVPPQPKGTATTSVPENAAGATNNAPAKVAAKKRCISFACAAKPTSDTKVVVPALPKPLEATEKPKEISKKTCIKFACPDVPPRAAATQNRVPLSTTPVPRSSRAAESNSSHRSGQLRPPSSRKPSRSPAPARSKGWLSADSTYLKSESSRFHEFASDEPQEDDWILRDEGSVKPKITISDTLEKENAIRKLGKEAEEEAEQEEQDEEDDNNNVEDGEEDDVEGVCEFDDEDEEDEDEDDGDEDDEDEDDDLAGLESEDELVEDASDGYKTDNEVGFADSDEEDDGLDLWSALGGNHRSFSGATAIYRRPSAVEHSDSSDCSKRVAAAARAKKRERRLAIRPPTPELPDSTDFVCGTLDEDRPLEEAYISHLAARKHSKVHLIPQDIDPSFPTSEPEDEGDDGYRRGHGDSDDNLWLHGELEDINHERDRLGRRYRADRSSPKRMRSPPPKRRHSPAPKARGRSPRRLSAQYSPRRLRSPAPGGATTRSSAAASPVQLDDDVRFKSLAFEPGLTHTKSLPRRPLLFPQAKPVRKAKESNMVKETHVRGAIDIVKGLEQKRQRRKEKFYQKYCSRARKEKTHMRPPPGQGAERMREVGLIMAGKVGQGNFVLSV